MSMLFKNTWGSPSSQIDQQRLDLFRFSLVLPPQLARDAGPNVWDKEVGWAVEKFPFPDRMREAVPIKYLNQTNFQIGADTASDSIELTVRYAFAQRTAQILERWHWLTSNPKTGGVALSSAVKTTGSFFWLVPNSNVVNVENAPEADGVTFVPLRAYVLEGVWVKGLSPAEPADMTSNNGLVSLKLVLQIDRYYPVNPSDLTLPYNIVAPNRFQ